MCNMGLQAVVALCSVVQQKVQESQIPERLAHHTANARDTAAAKVQDLSAQVRTPAHSAFLPM